MADSLPGAWRERIGRQFLPGRVLTRRPPADGELQEWLDGLALAEIPPIWADRDQRDGEPAIYVCRSFTCSPPQTEIDEALEWVEKLGTEEGTDPESKLGFDEN